MLLRQVVHRLTAPDDIREATMFEEEPRAVEPGSVNWDDFFAEMLP
jgi:hypothetical protein